MSTILITGANRGLGLEFARQYAADGWRVIACVRDVARAGALQKLGDTVEIHPLDVSDFAAIDQLAENLAGTAIDVLLLNAGFNPQLDAPKAEDADYELWPEVFRINTMAPLRLAVAFRDHVAVSNKKIIAAISSGGATVSRAKGGNYVYRSSKAALNLCMSGLAKEYANRGLTIVMLAPGWVRTEMGGPNARFSPEESVSMVRKVIGGLTAKDNGRFINSDGTDYPW